MNRGKIVSPTCTTSVFVVKKTIDHPQYLVPLEVGRRYRRAVLTSMGFEVNQPRFKEFFDEIEVNCYTGEPVNK